MLEEPASHRNEWAIDCCSTEYKHSDGYRELVTGQVLTLLEIGNQNRMIMALESGVRDLGLKFQLYHLVI